MKNNLWYNGDAKTNTAMGAGKESAMEEEEYLGELLVAVAEENQTRKVLAIINECKDLEEAKAKVKALLNE
ncbi:MAG: protein phosphatase [Clostridiales bacterium]|nr:protein phosphatase [Clostridiales bacterium]